MKGPKKINYELIPKDGEPGESMYAMLDELVNQFHEDELFEAEIALAWNKSWKPDVDGRRTLGKCKKASELDRDLHQYDFIVILHREFWLSPEVTDLQRRALLDHELCHAALKLDEDLEPVVDERGRRVYRTRKHDIQEFSAVVRRWGVWTKDLEDFAEALQKSKQGKLEFDSAGPNPLRTQLARDAAGAKEVRKAVEKLRPKPGGGLDSVSLTGPDGRGVRFNADGTTDEIHPDDETPAPPAA